jgi:hypothetical protein
MFGEIEIETASGCNRRCADCLRQSHPDRLLVGRRLGRLELLPEATVLSIIDQAVAMDFRGRLNLQFFNEPLMDERVAGFGRYAKRHGSFSSVSCYSNFDLITRARAAALDGAFDDIWVALYDPKVGGIPLAGGRKLREAYARSLFEETRIHFTGGGHMVTHYSPSPELPALIAGHQPEPCLYDAQVRFIIDHRGEMLMCCDDIGGAFNLGNVNDSTLFDLWFSERHQEIVTALSAPGGRAGYPYCMDCPR